jgi:hypothetical protein
MKPADDGIVHGQRRAHKEEEGRRGEARVYFYFILFFFFINTKKKKHSNTQSNAKDLITHTTTSECLFFLHRGEGKAVALR